jgi:3-isopropylmalate dehydrogenase
MASNKNLYFLPGDGIGQEVMDEVRNLVNWLGKHGSLTFDMEEGLIGGAAYDAHGSALSDETLSDAMGADAVLLGAVGGPQWDNVPRQHRPEAGLLRIRKEMDLFANLRPAIVFDALAEASSLKLDLVKGLDMLIIRELTGGVYFGEPRGIETLADGTRRGVDTQLYTSPEIERVARVAFVLAKQRGNKVHSVEKANVMETGILWRSVVSDLHAAEYSDVELHHMYADNCAMQLVREPKQFDVIVTDNLFGDILSDCAAMLTGSLGMLPSASLGGLDDNGRRLALYEPVHGSAPDISGQGIANPLACILSFAMCMRYSFDMGSEADMMEQAVQNVLASGLRTGDIMQDGKTPVSTAGMGKAVIEELEKLNG